MENGAYLAPAPAPAGRALSTNGSKTCIVIFTDAFGLPLKNCKIMADSVAEKLGVDVWVPDQFAGKAFLNLDDLNGLAPEIPGDKRTFLGTLQLLWLFIRRLPRFIQSRPSVCDARMSKFVKGLRNDQGYKTIGAIGYCWGGEQRN